MLIILGILAPIFFILALVVGNRSEKGAVRAGLGVAAVLALIIAAGYALLHYRVWRI